MLPFWLLFKIDLIFAAEPTAGTDTNTAAAVANNNSYNEILHINLSEDNIQARTHALSLLMRLMTAAVFPKVKGLLNTKK